MSLGGPPHAGDRGPEKERGQRKEGGRGIKGRRRKARKRRRAGVRVGIGGAGEGSRDH